MAGRHALIVATDAYADPKLSRLRAPARDADALAEVLRDPEIGEFEVELALNQPEAKLRRQIAAFFSDRGREELLLLHFSCHGLKDDSGQLFFAAADTEVAHLDATAIPAEFVSRQMARSRSNSVLMLLDCCYSGAIARGLTFRAGDRVDVNDHLGGSGRAIITASNAMEYAFEGDELTGEGRPSVFTSAVVKALQTGEADRDQDQWISVRELYDYVCDEVREITPNQRPNMLSHLEGELFVARSRWLAPATLPRELLDGLENQYPAVREGAVAGLAELLHGRDRALADAARRRLESIAAGDDSRRVTNAARVALAGASPEPAAPPEVAAPAIEPPPEVVAPPEAVTPAAAPAPEVAAPAAPPAPEVAAPPAARRRRVIIPPRAAKPRDGIAAPSEAPAPTATTPPPAAAPPSFPVRAWRSLDPHARWLVGAAVLIALGLTLHWDYGNTGFDLLNNDTYGPVGLAVTLTLIATLAAVWRRKRPLAYLLFVFAAATLGFVAAMLRVQDFNGEGAGMWIGIVGVAVALVTATRIVLEAPTKLRPRLLPAEVVGAAAGLYAAYKGSTYYETVATDVLTIAVAALATPVLALPLPARLRPLAIIGCGAFATGYLAFADLNAASPLIGGAVMMLAGAFALYQRSARP